MYEFVWPWVFLLLPIPIFFRKHLRRDESLEFALHVPFFDRLDVEKKSQTKKRVQLNLPLILISLAWFSLIASVAQPRISGEPIELPSSGRDLMLAVDISRSMAEEDMVYEAQRFSRIVVVKSILKDFLKKREGDRVGLILFGSNAYLQAPLTFDLNTVSQFIDEAVLGLAGRSTAIGDAIGLAIKRLKKRPESQRVLVLLTDGANTAGMDPRETIELAQLSKVKIYTVGVEAESRWRRSGLDENTLALLAQETGGQYFRARNPAELAQIYSRLDEIEVIEQDGEFFRPQKSLYYYPLLACIILLCLALASPLLQRSKVDARHD